MSYWGNVVLGRSAERLTRWAGVHLVGREHRWLREVGDGWQVLETKTFGEDPLDLAAGVAALVADTGAPAMAAYVSDDSCAALFAHTPQGRSWSAHLPHPALNNVDYEHPPGTARGRSVEAVCADVMAWAREAGLPASAGEVRRIVEHDRYADDSRHGLDADDQIFELFLALGLPRIPPSRRRRIDPLGRPFSLITDIAGLGMTARLTIIRNRSLDQGEEPEPIEDWMRLAAELDDDIWASVLEDHRPIPELIARIKTTGAAYIAANPDDEAYWAAKQRRRLSEDVTQPTDTTGVDPADWRAGRHPLGREA